MSLFSGAISTLSHALNYSATKQKVISQNIANVDTPNYKAKEVSFRAAYDQALNGSLGMTKTDPKHIDVNRKTNVSYTVLHKNPFNYHESGNSVDIDKEMTSLATNQIYYNALIERVSGKFSSLQNVIRGGK
ncbi:flagellar basal body rod protein FlgB [Niallia sp. Krafla_26]|uniref:flagellar basal body rod protein FlgB n=1 Tax=Niallia sp. Krafla_26 TaxID=3064703 RepID=UPI003D183267